MEAEKTTPVTALPDYLRRMNLQSPLLITTVVRSVNATEFVRFWNSQYAYPDLNVYESAITESPISEQSILRLFKWKNGMELSEIKRQSVDQKILSKLSEIHHLQRSFDEDFFNVHFGKLSTVWRVFLLHIIDHKLFPIFDQHVNRAYLWLQGKFNPVALKEPKVTIGEYSQYCKFYDQIVVESGMSTKDVDNALWSFGKFIKRYPRMVQSSSIFSLTDPVHPQQ